MKFVKFSGASLVYAVLVSGFITFLVVGTLYTRIQGSEVDKEAFLLNTSPTAVLDTNGDPLTKFFGERRSTAVFEEIPEDIVQALVDTEDRAFYDHSGINVRAISRAAVRIVQANGELVQGGSTITQQLIKRTHLTHEKSLERKQKEAILASVLEKEYSKDEILEMYLNQVYFGENAYGVKDAVRTYFGMTFEEFKKEPKDNQLVMSALIAGIPQAPSSYSPYFNGKYSEVKAERALKRRNEVLANLVENGHLDKERLKELQEMPLLVLEESNRVFEEEELKKQELVHYALYEAADILDMKLLDVMNSGLEIQTSFDVEVYDIVREEYEKAYHFPNDANDGTIVQSAAVYLNPKNGEIVAMTGGRGDVDFLGYNRAFMMERQPGSTFKPIASYGPALETGDFGPFSLLDDRYGTRFGTYKPKNWDNSSHGWITMQEAMAMSWNVPAVWQLSQVGVDYAKDYAAKLGIDLSDEPDYLTMALGGLEHGVSPLEMADAYQAFANKGVRTPAHAVRKIIDHNGEVVYEAETETEPVIDPENAKSMKGMLQYNVTNGVASRASIDGRMIAGKTGTAQFPTTSGNRDIWFVGFDEELLGAIWMGFDNTSKTGGRYLRDSSSVPTQFFSDMTEKILNHQSKESSLASPQDVIPEPPDTTAPSINIIGGSNITLTLGKEYNDAGATAKDDKDGDVTDSIKTEDNVISSVEGTYEVIYTVSDKLGNQARAVRKVTVAKPQPPFFMGATLSSDKVKLTWDKYSSKSDVRYDIMRNGDIIHYTSSTSYTDKSVTAGNTYKYQIVAVEKGSGGLLGKTKNTKTLSIPKKVEEPEDESATENDDESNNEVDDNEQDSSTSDEPIEVEKEDEEDADETVNSTEDNPSKPNEGENSTPE